MKVKSINVKTKYVPKVSLISRTHTHIDEKEVWVSFLSLNVSPVRVVVDLSDLAIRTLFQKLTLIFNLTRQTQTEQRRAKTRERY